MLHLLFLVYDSLVVSLLLLFGCEFPLLAVTAIRRLIAGICTGVRWRVWAFLLLFLLLLLCPLLGSGKEGIAVLIFVIVTSEASISPWPSSSSV